MGAIVPTQSELTAEASAVTLARYAYIIGYSECAFWGVVREGEYNGECRDLWTKPQRDAIARYLAEAQEEIETEIGFFLSPRYVVGALADQPHGNDRLVDDQVYTRPMSARWPKIISAGVRATETLEAGASVSLVADPATVTVVGVTLTDTSEVTVYHPGTEVEINPSSINLNAGTLTIRIPRCRLVKADLADNPETGLLYTDLANFESTVDVVRIYTDQSTNATLVAPHSCSSWCASGGCNEYTTPGCIYVVAPLIGTLDVKPASYTDGAWRPSGVCRPNTRARLNYLAGARSLTRQAEDTIVRLAHAKMPVEPCGCDVTQRLWKRDREEPEVGQATRERINCPFGFSEGAWWAYRFAQTMKLTRGSVI